MTYFILLLLFMLMIFLFTFKGNAVGTIPLGKVQSISYSQSFFINYTHIKTDRHTILLGHKMTNIKEDDFVEDFLDVVRETHIFGHHSPEITSRKIFNLLSGSSNHACFMSY